MTKMEFIEKNAQNGKFVERDVEGTIFTTFITNGVLKHLSEVKKADVKDGELRDATIEFSDGSVFTGIVNKANYSTVTKEDGTVENRLGMFTVGSKKLVNFNINHTTGGITLAVSHLNAIENETVPAEKLAWLRRMAAPASTPAAVVA